MGNCPRRQQQNQGQWDPRQWAQGHLARVRRWERVVRRVRTVVRWRALARILLLESQRSPAVRLRQGDWAALGRLLARHPWAVAFRERFQEARRQRKLVKKWRWLPGRRNSGRQPTRQ